MSTLEQRRDTLVALKQRDMTAMALRINIQDITPLVEGCRWLVEYRKDRPDVIAEYLRVLRSLTEAQAKAVEFGMGDGPLAQPIAPLPIWNNDYRWSEVLPKQMPRAA